MTQTDGMTVRFWGVRGSLACPGSETVRYGGNTSCLEIRCGGHLIILDAGTGLRLLGRSLNDKTPIDADLLFSHTHLDHIVGLPFFAPLFGAENTLRLWAGHLKPDHSLKEVVKSMMTAPLFPVPPELFAAKTSYNDFVAGEELDLRPNVRVITTTLSHPDNATGYRIEFEGKSVCYVTDTEHSENGLDQQILELIDGADLVIYDSTYTDEEYHSESSSKVGWGHSTWQEAVKLARAANVKKLVVFHHDPLHDDDFMDDIGRQTAAEFPNSIVACEGMVLDLADLKALELAN